MSATVYEGETITKDPNSIQTYVWNWDDRNLATGVSIASSSWIIAGPDSALTKDQESIVTGDRKTQVRLSAGTLGGKYTVTNRIVTNETPAQTKDWSMKFRIGHK